MAENVKGLKSHDGGRTLETMVDLFSAMGYEVLEPTVLKGIHYNVPQKRERIFIVGIKKSMPQK